MIRTILCAEKQGLVDCWRKEFAGFPHVEVKQGDILAQACDAMVSPANSHGFMDGGLDYQLREFFGREIEERVQRMIRDKHDGELLVGQAEVMETGHARVPFLVVAPTLRVPMELGPASINPYLAARAAFLAVEKFNSQAGPKISTVAFPGLGTGVGRVPYEVAAAQMRRAYDDVVLSKGRFPSSLAEAQQRHLHLFFSEGNPDSRKDPRPDPELARPPRKMMVRLVEAFGFYLARISAAAYFIEKVGPDPAHPKRSVALKQFRNIEMALLESFDFLENLNIWAFGCKPFRRGSYSVEYSSISPRRTEVNSWLDKTLAGLTIPKTIEVVRRFDSSNPSARIDPDYGEVAIRQLVKNAVYSMRFLPESGERPGKGRLTISTAVHPEGWVVIGIQDTGCGMPREEVLKIFTPFYCGQAAECGWSADRGGLGLTVVKTIVVDHHSGRVEVGSTPNEGTLFMLSFPRSESC